jgi:4-amino-4-deoxy-L-arabinose transferase-like glycosyltransferase
MRETPSDRADRPRHLEIERLAWAAVLVGLFLRVIWVLVGPRVVIFDAVTYRELAHSLAAGHGYATSDGPTAFWVPGWPAWMSLFYRAGLGDTAVAIGSVGLGAATLALTHRLTDELHGKRAAWIATAIVALLPSLLVLPGLLVSENLTLPLTTAGALLLVRARKRQAVLPWVQAGLCCGAAVLVREASLALALAGVLLGLWFARSIAPRRVAPFLLGVAILVAPWVVRNRASMGVARLTTSGAINLCVGLGEEATGGSRFIPWAGEEREADARALECVRQGLQRRPFQLVTLAPAKLSRWFAYDDWEFDVFYSRALPEVAWRALGAACDLSYWAILGSAIVAIVRRRGDPSLLVILACFLSATLLTFGNARFHVVALPILAVLASTLWGEERRTSAPAT